MNAIHPPVILNAPNTRRNRICNKSEITAMKSKRNGGVNAIESRESRLLTLPEPRTVLTVNRWELYSSDSLLSVGTHCRFTLQMIYSVFKINTLALHIQIQTIDASMILRRQSHRKKTMIRRIMKEEFRHSGDAIHIQHRSIIRVEPQYSESHRRIK